MAWKMSGKGGPVRSSSRTKSLMTSRSAVFEGAAELGEHGDVVRRPFLVGDVGIDRHVV